MLFFRCDVPQNDCNLVQTPCPRKPVPVLCYPESKKVFLDVQKDLAVFQFVPIVTEKKLNVLWTFPLVFLHTLIRSSRTFSSPGWTVLAFCLCSYGRCSSPLMTSVALCWTLSTMSHLSSAAEAKTGHSSPGTASSMLNRGERSPLATAGKICWQDLLATPV